MFAGAMIHERKFQLHREVFFNCIMKGVKTKKSVAIATDEEAAIVNAIQNCTSWVRLGCHHHLISDIDRWVEEHLGNKDDKRVYIDDVLNLLHSSSFKGFTEALLEGQKKWSEPFVTYFQSHWHEYMIMDFGQISAKFEQQV